MQGAISLIKSGFSLVDKEWGGIYRGGSYLLIGPRKSGRTLLGLQFAIESAKANEVCLYFTNMRPKDLMIQAASINFDIQNYMNQNKIIVVRVAPPNDIYDLYNPDQYLIEYLNDIVTVVNQYNPSRIIFDELTPYIGFQNVDLLRESFLKTLEQIEELNITSLFVVGEPATKKAEEIIDGISQYVTGIVFLKKRADKIHGAFHGGTVIISPNVGHTEGQFSSEYIIEPYKGVSIEIPQKNSNLKNTIETSNKIEDLKNQEYQHAVQNTEPESKPTKITNISPPKDDGLKISNVYSKNDFSLILNNQIALYKSTGQQFHLVSFKLDEAAVTKELLTLDQLKNSILYSIEKKDKVCVIENLIVVMLIRSSNNSVAQLIEKMQHFLPSHDPVYLTKVLGHISYFAIPVNEDYVNSEDMFNILLRKDNLYLPMN